MAPLIVLCASPPEGVSDVDEEVARALAAAAHAVIQRLRFSAVVATGGDTAIALARQLQAERLRPLRLLDTGIAESVVIGGPHVARPHMRLL